MGRRRSKNLDLPPRLHLKAGGYYHVSSSLPRKWTALASDKAEALRRWAELEGAQSADGTVCALADAYLSRCISGMAETTQRNYRRMGAEIKKRFGTALLDQMKPSHVAQYLDLHPHHPFANNVTALLSAMYEKAMRWGWTEKNPTKGIRRHPRVYRKRYLSDDEYAHIWGQAPETLRIAMDLANLTGLRIGDVTRLHLADLDDAELRVVQQKTKRLLIFEMTPELAAVVTKAKALPRPVRTLFLLTSRGGHPYRPGTLSEAFREAARAAGVADVRFHDIRAKVASDDPENAQARLDHKDARTTAIYLRRPRSRVVPLSRKTSK